MEILKTINLCKTYGSAEAKVEALKNVNFSVQHGEFVAIVGASGSGKSTLMHLLGGVDRPASGQVIIDGTDLYSRSEEELAVFRRRKIGFIFQSYNLIPVLSTEENIKLPMLLENKRVDENYVQELMGILGLTERRHHLPSELSGGQQQRTAIGRALINKPSIILADEPTGNLDSKNSRDIMDLLMFSVKKYNQTLIMITHDLNIAKIADRVVRIEDGVLLQANEVSES
ncbi:MULTISPECIES: ABC transporter ATP-binding protein [Paenibacillus]|uniref:ABC transporter ATP-binding protein n=1 Tax=Paenibacillus polymyxa TaxID=1406 RepID=A0AAP3ZXP1_PAEPO|nr:MULTISPECIES: ABC transporter ATP-binding protein [Paenibacillus]ALA42355.1 peptide ABC transporter ATP-binding protein [Paenibacillus peoriae]APB75920.1 ABC transporter ATP-binding protein [Paenibacillus polymyxa]APQ59537.1 peptide ABC transporter ATP-binding protein [Paenibacillus polymyxa]MDH2331526.1 ABC transporter ATP-binding protein [Paenibacillus polymyxa]ODB63066.1 peptide ABC transporter ATP-binding protein [Paenibacillus polymyxa]